MKTDAFILLPLSAFHLKHPAQLEKASQLVRGVIHTHLAETSDMTQHSLTKIIF